MTPTTGARLPVVTVAGVETAAACLIPLADGSFVPGTCDNALVKEVVPVEHFRFDGSDGPIPWMLEFTFKDGKASSFVVPAYAFTAKRIDRAP